MSNRHLFTPLDPATGERLQLHVSVDDIRQCVPRSNWIGVFTDLDSGIAYRCKSAPCGLGCNCDANVLEVVATSA